MSAWHEEARRLYADGATIKELCTRFSRSRTAVRCAVDMRYLAKQNEQTRKFKAQDRERRKGLAKGARVRVEPRAEPIDRSIQYAYADKPVKRVPGLPKISLAHIPDEPVVRKFAPRVHVREESPGVRRWREHNEQLLRSGRITPATDLVSEWRI